MPRAAPKEADPVEAIMACLKQDAVVGEYAEGLIGRVGTLENRPRYIEIGHTREHPVAESASEGHLVTVHVWSKCPGSEEVLDVLHAAERAIAAMDHRRALKREFTEVRYDDRNASQHGLLRLRF